MYAKIQKWGNSNAIRIPKGIFDLVKLKENDKVEIKVEGGNIIIIPFKKHKSLDERIAEYKGDYICSEWDTGKKSGNEVF